MNTNYGCNLIVHDPIYNWIDNPQMIQVWIINYITIIFCKYKLPITEKIYNRIVRLPLFSDITENEFKKISLVLRKFVKM